MSFRRQEAHFSTKCFGKAWPEIEFIIRWCSGKGSVHSNFERTQFDSGKWSCIVNTVNSDCSVRVLNVLCTSPSQDSVSDWHTSLHHKSQSGVANLDLDFPSKGFAHSCSQMEELRVACNSEGELLQCTCASNATQCNRGREGPYLLIIPPSINTPLFCPLSWWSFKCTVECSKQYYT